MVEEEDWSTDLAAPMEWFNEAGECVETMDTVFETKHMPLRPQEPRTLHELLNPKAKVEKAKAPTKRRQGWAGTRGFEE